MCPPKNYLSPSPFTIIFTMETLARFGATKRPPPRSIFGRFPNLKRGNLSTRSYRQARLQGGERRPAVPLQRGDLLHARAAPKKYSKKNHIINRVAEGGIIARSGGGGHLIAWGGSIANLR